LGDRAGEVADEIDRLNGRPDSTDRCPQAVQTYLVDPSEENRLAIRQRYLTIPKHRRMSALGDMDRKDAPLRILITDVGQTLYGWPYGLVVTDQKRAEVVEYFHERNLAAEAWQKRMPADGPEHATRPALTVPKGVYPERWSEPSGIEVLTWPNSRRRAVSRSAPTRPGTPGIG
jgi:hypothetical protein